MKIKLPIEMAAQPDDVTCGPTSLYAVYRFFNYPCTLEQVIKGVKLLKEGGTLAVYLGLDALKKGFKAELYTYNLHIFDPTWMELQPSELVVKLRQQLEFKKGKKFKLATEAYIQYLNAGGRICFENLTRKLLVSYFEKGLPILAGLSSTYLYQSMREYSIHGPKTHYDDLRGNPTGHFVVLAGINLDDVYVSDPFHENPYSRDHFYSMEVEYLINSILLGIMTYDGNMLIISRD
ncbi:MAG: hypothetical protein JXR70_13525 [Spirochaetales bacterium]|nr:hypothetical protein [Spirochaetales bacterium]